MLLCYLFVIYLNDTSMIVDVGYVVFCNGSTLTEQCWFVYNSIGSSTEERLMFPPCTTRMEDIDIGRELYVNFFNEQL